MNKSKVAIVSNQIWQKIESFLGWTISAFSLLCIIIDLADTNSEDFALLLVFFLITLALGVLLIVKGKRRKKLISTFKDYVQILAGDPNNSLDTIAEKTRTSVDVVRKNVSKMIRKSYFANARIDKNTNSLIFNRKVNTQQILSEKASDSTAFTSTNTSHEVRTTTAATEILSVKCKGCGAVTVVQLGKLVECEYCGNMVKGEKI